MEETGEKEPCAKGAIEMSTKELSGNVTVTGIRGQTRESLANGQGVNGNER